MANRTPVFQNRPREAVSPQTGKMGELTERFKFMDKVRRNGSNNEMKRSQSQCVLGEEKKGQRDNISIYHGHLM